MLRLPSCQADGDPASPLLIIGMAPGETELEEDRPFVGPSGSLLWSAATRSGFSRADCFILNVIGEIQEDKKGPSPRQLAAYWDAFNEGLELSQARSILCLGADAFYRMTGLKGALGTARRSWRGYLVPAGECKMLKRPKVTYSTFKSGKRKGQPKTSIAITPEVPLWPRGCSYVIPTMHPSYIMRMGFKPVPVFYYDVDRAWRAATGALVDPLAALPNWGVAFDIETTGTSLHGADAITRVSFATSKQNTTMGWGGRARTELKDVLAQPLVKVGHNMSFDVPRLEASNVPVPQPWFDTMLAAQLLQPDLFKGLKYAAPMYLDVERWDHKADTNPALYNLRDSQYTLALAGELDRALTETGQMELFANTIMPTLPELIELHVGGLRVDLATRHSLNDSFSVAHRVARDEWMEISEGVNAQSNPQLHAFVYGKLGLPVQKDDEGKPTLDDAAVKTLLAISGRRELEILVKVREAKKALDFIGVPLSNRRTVHPLYLPGKKDDDEEGSKGLAGTGRIQAKDPNIMQVPKAIRVMYIPHDPANLLVEYDFDQAELRVIAGLSGDSALAKALEGDVHQYHADLWGCSRDEAKTTTYAVLYGAGPRKLQMTFMRKGTTKTQAACKALLDAFFETNRGVAAYRQEIITRVQADRQLRNPFGRHRYFWYPSRDIPAALDFMPQSTVADILWASIHPIASLARDVGGRLLTIVHDSFLLEVPTATDLTPFTTLLTRPYHNIAPDFFLPVKFKVGKTWGSVKPRSIP